jgi:hypothetical protein
MKKTARVLLAVAVGVLLLSQSDCPDYSKDSEDGSIPAGAADSGIVQTFTIDKRPSNPLRCNEIFHTRAVTHEGGVNCAGYDFAAIYKQADSAAEKRANEMKCPTMDCKTLVTGREWHSWNCAGGNADATVNWFAVCPRTETPVTPPPTVPRPTAAQLQAPNPNATVPPTTNENADITGGTTPIKCSPLQYVTYHYVEAVNPRPKDLKEYVDIAVDRAKRFDATLKCQDPPCKKQPFSPVKTVWSWAGGKVTVDVYFIPCK